MRRYVMLITAFFLLRPVSGLGATLVAGTVLSVNRAGGVFTVRPEGTDRRVIVAADPANIPETLGPGSAVRAWGVFHPTDPGRFGAYRILSGAPPERRSAAERPPAGDPTGVRSRLYRSGPPPVMEGFR